MVDSNYSSLSIEKRIGARIRRALDHILSEDNYGPAGLNSSRCHALHVCKASLQVARSREIGLRGSSCVVSVLRDAWIVLALTLFSLAALSLVCLIVLILIVMVVAALRLLSVVFILLTFGSFRLRLTFTAAAAAVFTGVSLILLFFLVVGSCL
jgi:hypothetical protein